MGIFDHKPKAEAQPKAEKSAECAHRHRAKMPATLRSAAGWMCTDCGATGEGLTS